MRPTPLAQILSALAHSKGLVPDADDRKRFAVAAECAAAMEKQPTLLIVTGPDADPVVDEVQSLGEQVGELQTLLYGVGDHVDDLLRVMRQRRHDATASGQPSGESGQ